MPRRVVIVGNLPSRPVRAEVLHTLRTRKPDVDWEGYQPTNDALRLDGKFHMRLSQELLDEQKNNTGDLKVVKLFAINGADGRMVHRLCDPAMPPAAMETAEALVEWLLNPDHGLVQRTVFFAPAREASLIALAAKMARNKSWNKDKNGHMW